MEEDGYMVDFRLPNSLDILEAMYNKEIATDPAKLLSRCILKVHHNHAEEQVELPHHLMATLEDRMGEADPQAIITMVLNCPDCKTRWNSTFDIIQYLWMEIDNWAKKLLREVATLARAFGWSEKEILNLSHNRRRMYLDLIN
jgi:hypothetical protein